MVNFALPKRLSVLQWSPQEPYAVARCSLWAFSRGHPLRSQRSCSWTGVSDQFITYTGGTDLAILLDKDTFEPDAAVLVIAEASSSKDTWSMAALVVRGLLRRPSLSGTPTVTFRSVHVHNVVAQKRDNSTALLRRLYAHMLQHNVDFIGCGLQHERILQN